MVDDDYNDMDIRYNEDPPKPKLEEGAEEDVKK